MARGGVEADQESVAGSRRAAAQDDLADLGRREQAHRRPPEAGPAAHVELAAVPAIAARHEGNGEAHEISEGDTYYLAACTKGSSAKDTTSQPKSEALLPLIMSKII